LARLTSEKRRRIFPRRNSEYRRRPWAAAGAPSPAAAPAERRVQLGARDGRTVVLCLRVPHARVPGWRLSTGMVVRRGEHRGSTAPGSRGAPVHFLWCRSGWKDFGEGQQDRDRSAQSRRIEVPSDFVRPLWTAQLRMVPSEFSGRA